MHAQIEILASLQTIDREIKQQNDIKRGLLSDLESKEKDIQAKKIEIDGLTAAFSDLEKLRVAKDRVFQNEGKKAMDKRMRMNRIKNAKELQALQREIDVMREANGELEEELINIMQQMDGIKTQLQAKEAEIAALNEEWQKQRLALETQISGIDRAVIEAGSRRHGIAAQITGDLISRYELIFSRRGGTAVVEVSGGICQGCYMNVPPQLSNEVIRSDQVHLCPSCQRILYVRSTSQ